jgi:hypothetical protein
MITDNRILKALRSVAGGKWNFIHADDGFIISTNGFSLLALKIEIDDGTYSLKTGERINPEDFPNWKFLLNAGAYRALKIDDFAGEWEEKLMDVFKSIPQLISFPVAWKALKYMSIQEVLYTDERFKHIVFFGEIAGCKALAVVMPIRVKGVGYPEPELKEYANLWEILS